MRRCRCCARWRGIATLETLLERLDARPAIVPRSCSRGSRAAYHEHRRQACARHGADARFRRRAASCPAWDLIDVERYRAVWRRAHGRFSLNMAASRGCSFRCTWCAKPIWGNHYLQRPAADVAAEMSYIKRALAAEHIWFADDIFGFRVDWVNDLRTPLRPRAAAFRSPSRHVPISSASAWRRAERGRLPRGLARRRERQPACARRHEQRHPCDRDPRGARSGSAPRASASDSSSSWVISVSSSPTFSRRASSSRPRAPTTSASASPTLCREPSSTSS